MGFFSRLKNRSPTKIVKYELLQEQGNSFYSWDGNLYYSDLVRACIRPKVKAIGKLNAKHIRSTENADGTKRIETNPSLNIRFLLEEPNPIMTGQMFQEKMAAQLCLNNNAFALIVRNENGIPIQLYPIIANSVEAIYNKQHELFLRFQMKNGKVFTFPYSEIIHLRNDYNENDIFGSGQQKALAPLMEIIGTTDQGIVNAIKNSAVIKWLLKFNSSMRPDDLKNQVKNFAKNFLDTKDSVGVAAVDAKGDVEQIKPTDYVPNAAQMAQSKERLYSTFNTNEKIVQSDYTEDQWISYFEAQIEPDSRQFGEEMTRKLFTRRERALGNRIYYEAGSLQYASMSTKLNLQAMVDRGAMTPNEWREAFNLAPLPGGDEPIRRLDTQPISEGGETE